MKTTLGNFLLQINKSFPHDCELYESMQENLFLVSVLGNIGGDKIILSGCELYKENRYRQPGYVFLRTEEYPEGEVLFWKGGSVADGIYLCKEHVSVNENEYPEAYTVRYLAEGIGTENYTWDDFRVVTTNLELIDKLTAHEQLSTNTFEALHTKDGLLTKEIEQLNKDFSRKLEEHENKASNTFNNLKEKDEELGKNIQSVSDSLTAHKKASEETFKTLQSKDKELTDAIEELDKEFTGKVKALQNKDEELNNSIKRISDNLTAHEKAANDTFGDLQKKDKKLEDAIEILDTSLSGKIDTHVQEAGKSFEELISKGDQQDLSIKKLSDDITGLDNTIQQITEGTIVPKVVEKLKTARTIELTGKVTGKTSFDGSQNVQIEATVVSTPRIINNNGQQKALSIWVGTQLEYDSITTKDEYTIYNIT